MEKQTQIKAIISHNELPANYVVTHVKGGRYFVERANCLELDMGYGWGDTIQEAVDCFLEWYREEGKALDETDAFMGRYQHEV